MGQYEKTPLKTLSSCIAKLQQDGFSENFMVPDCGTLHAITSSKFYKPSDVKIVNFYRFEGENDPADSAILYAIETNDGIKGLLSDSYGPYADANTGKFIMAVEDITKKTDPGKKL